MIYVEMAGRCGNQLFHYACARAIQEKTKEELVFNFNKVFVNNPADGHYNCLSDYNVVPYEIYPKSGTILKRESSPVQKILIAAKALYIKIHKNKSRQEQADNAEFMNKILNKHGIYWIREGVCNITVKTGREGCSIVSGVCEAPDIFNEIKGLLQEELTPKIEPKKDVASILKQMKQTNSVCLNVRRGDFLNESNVRSFSVCTRKYYENAIEILRYKLDNPVFYVVSDDITWCKENIVGPDICYTPLNLPVYESLRLIYTCKHFIISNSTFSWWGQFLSRNPSKIVVSPSRWNNDGYNSLLIQKDWILLEP